MMEMQPQGSKGDIFRRENNAPHREAENERADSANAERTASQVDGDKIAEPEPVGNASLHQGADGGGVAASETGAFANSPHAGDDLLPLSDATEVLAKCHQITPNNTLDSKALSDWWDFSGDVVLFDAGELADDELWRMEKKGKGTFIYVLRFVKTRITRYGGTITPYIENKLAERRGRGRWQQSRKDASRLRRYAHHLAAELNATTEGGIRRAGESDAAGCGDSYRGGAEVSRLQVDSNESLPNVRGGFIN
jgi:hypothetical protein